MTDTEPAARRRSTSITEYSQIFAQTGPKTSSFINQKRHPSLSMRHDRVTSLGKLGVNVTGLTAVMNENAIDDAESSTPTSHSANSSATVTQQRSKTDDPVALSRRLSLGGRAIMFNGNRLRGDSFANGEGTSLGRSASYSSATSTSPRAPPGEFDSRSPVMEECLVAEIPTEAAKQIRRRMSPTGERMLRGELAFH